ncbi:hypothetical protein ACTFIU_008620 [Dictyostelium citrinum]
MKHKSSSLLVENYYIKGILDTLSHNISKREKFQAFADDSLTLARNYKEQALLMVHFEHFSQATSSKLNKHKSASIVIGIISDKLWYTPEIEESKADERYLGNFSQIMIQTQRQPTLCPIAEPSSHCLKEDGVYGTLKKDKMLKKYGSTTASCQTSTTTKFSLHTTLAGNTKSNTKEYPQNS